MRILITGGAGFIGSNLAAHHLQQGHEVTLFDNLARRHTERNLEWLRACCGSRGMAFAKGDIRNLPAVRQVMRDSRPDLVVHLAAQVAVTASVSNPREDFEINAGGTLNILEVAREQNDPPAVFYASTNKVYGQVPAAGTVLRGDRYCYRDLPGGVDEETPLGFVSPYGCSKGASDQYVRDYARTFSLRTVVFRQSCIYGERQFGVEDQGWVAHFLIAAALGRSITIYGDGRQVRDLLNVSDLITMYDLAWAHLPAVSGEVFNVGGGPANSVAVWSEFGPILNDLAGRSIRAQYADWRPGDQKVYVSNNTKAREILGWEPQIPFRDGIRRVWDWVVANRELFQ